MSDSSSLEKTFSEFDANKATKSETTDSLLYPEHENYEYRRIRNTVIHHGKLSKEDASAILLQKTYRMYRIHKYFANYYRQFQHVKKVTMRPYFIAFVLNSHASNCDRRKLYETQFSRALFCKKLFKGYTHPPFEVFTVTNQCLLPPYIDSSVLSQFVKKVYHTLILRAFLEWRIVARKQVIERKRRANKQIDIIKCQMFGNEYVCFNLWYRYTKRKMKKKMNDKARIPQWDYYMNLIDKKNAKYQKSLDIRRTTIKKMAIQALLNRVIEIREEENVLIEADKFRVKRNMIFALSAWAHYIVIQHNRVNTMRAILREWFRLIQQRIHFRNLLQKFQPRHSYYSKRAIFSMFMKNRQISQITSTYLYCKLQTKPSLALYFISILRHDDDISPFYLAFHAWVSTYRRRKKWQHFIFQDLKTSNYDIAKRKAIHVLKKLDTLPSLFTSNFISPNFHQETLFLYEYVMKMRTEYESIFLLSHDEEDKEAVANSTSATEQRELFFKMWLKMKIEPTLIMRLATINMDRRRSEKANETMKQGERTLSAYQKAVTFLESYNMASEEKFKILKKTIEENNRRALANRTRCAHRDKMIIFSHYSHFDAESLKVVKPLFSTNDKLLIVSKIVEATNELTESFQTLINIAGLGKSLTDPNTLSFSKLVGCKSPIKPFNIDHKTLQTKFMTQMKKGQLSPITQIQFERLMAGSVNDTAYRNLKTYQRMDPYAAPLIESKPPPITGVNRRLLLAFPLKGRKPIKIGHKTKKKVNFNVFNVSKEEVVEEEDEFDGFDDIGIGNFRKPLIINPYDKSKGSMFFNSIKSFANIISNSSFAIFGPVSSTEGMDISHISVPIEEVNEEGFSDSDSNSGRSSKRSTNDDDENENNSKLIGHLHKNNFPIIIEDDEGEEEEENLNEEIKNQSKSQDETNASKQDKKTITFRGLTDGFDDELMKSVNKSNPPRSPDASRKAKLFIEILFGRASKNLISIPMMNLKKRLIQELKNQKEGAPIPGIMTQETVMPIANLLELYKEDREKQERISNTNSSEINSSTDEFSKKHENVPQKTSARADLYTVNYRSKRYRPLPKKEKKHKQESLFDSNPENEIGDGKSENELDGQLSTENDQNEIIQSIDTSKINGIINNEEDEDEDEEEEYEYEIEEDENGKKIKKRRKKKVSKGGNKGKGKSKNKDEKSNKKNGSHSTLSKNKSESSRNKHSKGNKEKENEKENELKSGRKRRKTKSNNQIDAEKETKKKKRRKSKKKQNEDDSYTYYYSDQETEEKQEETTEDSTLDKLKKSTTTTEEEEENENENENEKSTSSKHKKNWFDYDEDDDEDEDEGEEIKEDEETKNEEDEDEFTSLHKTENNETSEKLAVGSTSSQNSLISISSSKKNRTNNSVTPFISSEIINAESTPLSSIDKVAVSFLKKNLEEEEQLDLVDLDGFDDKNQKNNKNRKYGMNQNRDRLWKAPRFSQFSSSHHRTPLINKSLNSRFNKGQPIIMKDEKIITPSMRQTMHEESMISKIYYHNGKTLIKPAKKTSESQSKPILNSYFNNNKNKFLSSQDSSRDLLITKIGGNINFDKNAIKKGTAKTEMDEDQVVSFGGGGRGISEEALNLQRIRALRNKHLIDRQELKMQEKIEFIKEIIQSNKMINKKAKEYEDLRSDFSDLRSIVTQLIQMMASSRDDSKEFENLRKRAKFLRKKPAFVGLVVPDKLTFDQFYKKMQSIFMKYMRKKNAQKTANELFQLMKSNLEFAPIIIKVIEKTANEERRYIDSKLQRSRLGRQPTDQGDVVHYIDLDWMTQIPDYNSVALQYKFGFDNPDNLDAIVAPTKENKNEKLNKKRFAKKVFNFTDPSKTNWDRTLEKFELQDLVMISSWVPESLMDEVIADNAKYRRNVHHLTPDTK